MESVKKLEWLQVTGARSIKMTSLTGRPGMSRESEELSAATRIKLGKNVSLNGNKHPLSDTNERHVRLG